MLNAVLSVRYHDETRGFTVAGSDTFTKKRDDNMFDVLEVISQVDMVMYICAEKEI